MRRGSIIPFLLFVLTSVAGLAAQHPPRAEVLTLPVQVAAQTQFLNPEYLLLTPLLADSDEKLPLLIYLHGAGGAGNDVRRIEAQPRAVLRSIERFGHSPCQMVAPQCRRQSDSGVQGVWIPGDLDLFLEHLKASLPVDPSRIYLTGNSMGGYGTWAWGATRPEHFAAIAPVVGGIGRKGPKDVTPDLDRWIEKLLKVPVWAFVGGEDRVVPAEHSERIINAVKARGHQNAGITVYPEMGHNAARRAYEDPGFYHWLFAQNRD